MKAVSVEEAVAMIPAGASIMVGGFMGVGTPERLLDEMVRQHSLGHQPSPAKKNRARIVQTAGGKAEPTE